MNQLVSTITLKGLSKVTGYSISTISKALNDKLDISYETRQKIKNTAEAYNYVPNNYAVALRKKRTKAISVIIPNAKTPLFSCFLYNIQKVAYSFGYKIFLFQSFEEDVKEEEFIRTSNDGSIDGVIILSKNKFHTKQYKKNSSLPIEYMQITSDLSIERLKEDCIKSFSKLVTRID